MRILRSRDPDGPIYIHDARLYRWRENHGKFNHKYTRPQLERMIREYFGPVPIRDTHNYQIAPPGQVGRFWFGNDGWLHWSGRIGNRQELGSDRYDWLMKRFNSGMLNCCSISVAMAYKDRARRIFDPDSARLVDAIDTRETVARQRINALVQVNTSGESTKSGCGAEECRAVCERVVKSPLLNLRGLMTIGPLGGSESALRASFAMLRRLGVRIADLVDGPPDLSMGMSGDFEQAIEEGATIIRVGTILLGPR
jgi:hypothetical protein